MIWNSERIEQLRILWEAGKTAGEIAREFGIGVTRSSILGKLRRLGLLRSAEHEANRPKRPRKTVLPRPTNRPLEQRLKISASMKRSWQDPEIRARITAARHPKESADMTTEIDEEEEDFSDLWRLNTEIDAPRSEKELMAQIAEITADMDRHHDEMLYLYILRKVAARLHDDTTIPPPLSVEFVEWVGGQTLVEFLVAPVAHE